MKDNPTVLMATSKWWPLAARLAVTFDRHGCEVHALFPKHHFLQLLPSVRRSYRYRSLDPLVSLRDAIDAANPDLIVPCDDGVVLQLHALHARESRLRLLIESSLGPARSFRAMAGRFELMELARELGVTVPRYRKLGEIRDLIDWHDNVSPTAVVKVDGAAGGTGVRICRSLAESAAALTGFRAVPGRITGIKRSLVDRDPLALWSRRHGGERAVCVQEFIPGRPANSMVACWRGRLLGVVSVAVIAAEGPTGASTVVRIIRNERMHEAAERICSRLELSGFFGLDFILDEATGTPYLIELNPRCTQLGHLELPRVGSLAGALVAAMMGHPAPMATQPVRSDVIALYPQALNAGAEVWDFVETGHHDVPEDALLRNELAKPLWPQRQWLSRLYHLFRRAERRQPTLFEILPEPTPALAEKRERSVA